MNVYTGLARYLRHTSLHLVWAAGPHPTRKFAGRRPLDRCPAGLARRCCLRYNYTESTLYAGRGCRLCYTIVPHLSGPLDVRQESMPLSSMRREAQRGLLPPIHAVSLCISWSFSYDDAVTELELDTHPHGVSSVNGEGVFVIHAQCAVDNTGIDHGCETRVRGEGAEVVDRCRQPEVPHKA